MSSISKPTFETDEDILYPSSDGEPVGETDWHMMALIWLREAMEDAVADRPDVKVATDMFLYYIEGDPSACKAPDVMVIKGVAKHWRRTFKTWAEKALPCTIIEIVSERTLDEDLGDKRTTYAQLGVAEYLVFDPEAKYLQPPLQGSRLKGNHYVPMTVARDGSLTSKQLGLRLIAEGPMLRLIDLQTGLPVLTRQEAKEQAIQRAEHEKQRADTLEAEVAQLRAAQARSKEKKKRR